MNSLPITSSSQLAYDEMIRQGFNNNLFHGLPTDGMQVMAIGRLNTDYPKAQDDFDSSPLYRQCFCTFEADSNLRWLVNDTVYFTVWLEDVLWWKPVEIVKL